MRVKGIKRIMFLSVLILTIAVFAAGVWFAVSPSVERRLDNERQNELLGLIEAGMGNAYGLDGEGGANESLSTGSETILMFRLFEYEHVRDSESGYDGEYVHEAEYVYGAVSTFEPIAAYVFEPATLYRLGVIYGSEITDSIEYVYGRGLIFEPEYVHGAEFTHEPLPAFVHVHYYEPKPVYGYVFTYGLEISYEPENTYAHIPLPTYTPTAYIPAALPAPESLCYSEFPQGIIGIGILTIERLDIRLPVMDGIGDAELRLAIGRVPQTARIGETGNAVIAGHRNFAHGSMFNRLDETVLGDIIEFQAICGEVMRFRVFEITTVLPNDQIVFIQPQDRAIITLYTCTPIRVASHRLIVRAEKI